MGKALELTGQRFGCLTVCERGPRHPVRGSYSWVCQCSCGGKATVTSGNLKSGNTVSCGCIQSLIAAENARRRNTTHSMTHSKAFKVWSMMRERCEKDYNASYGNYGGRGISICERWQTFENFFADMGDPPSRAHSIDRFPDNDGNYEPGNCRWATVKEQSRNRRTNHLLTLGSETMTLVEWAEKYGANPKVVNGRIRIGWDLLRALTVPRGKIGRPPSRR